MTGRDADAGRAVGGDADARARQHQRRLRAVRGAILLTLVFGRWFCGWACHLVALQDLCAWLLGASAEAAAGALAPAGAGAVGGRGVHVRVAAASCTARPARAPSPEAGDWELAPPTICGRRSRVIMAPLTLLVVGFLIVWWLGAKGFCTHGCPYGAFFARPTASRRAHQGHRRVRRTAATARASAPATCACTRRSPSTAKIVDPGCMKCLDCVSVCPKDALYFGLARRSRSRSASSASQARADFTWPEEIALAVVAFGSAEWALRGAWFGEACRCCWRSGSA
jgi:polyferredoxin